MPPWLFLGILVNSVAAQTPVLWKVKPGDATKIIPAGATPYRVEVADPLTSTVATGTAPFFVSSTTLVNNLNVERLNGQAGSYYLDLGNATAGTLAVNRGGTGQSSYTNGQLLIGNTTANTLSLGTLTGTANQVVVTNGDGSITLSGPQDLATASTPRFNSLGLGVAASSTAALNVVKNTTDPFATQFLMNLGSTANSLTANNANAIVGVATDVRINQNGFNYTATAGLRGSNNAVYSTGSDGTVTNIYGTASVAGNTGAGTLTSGTAYLAGTALNSGGGTFTTNTGFDCLTQTVGTNIYGYRGRIASTAGRYNLYMDGTAQNYIEGSTGIGTSTTSAAKLTVLSTTEPQLAVQQSGSVYATLGVAATTGITTLTTVGSAPGLSMPQGIVAGTGTARAKVGGTIFDYYTDTTVGGAEADIYTDSIPANTLAANGDKLHASWSGNYATIGSEATQLKVYFGGTAIYDSNSQTTSPLITSWTVDCTIIRVSSTVIRYNVRYVANLTTGFVFTKTGELTGLTLGNANTLKITGTSSGSGSGSGDIIGRFGSIDWKPAK